MRIDERLDNQIRNCKITTEYTLHPEGSVLIEMGNTKVICNATIDEAVPFFQREVGEGWISAEYSMLPRATSQRIRREAIFGKQTSRSVEIQRFISRALKASLDLRFIQNYRIVVDCDVIQADGGTRTAAVTGGFVAVYLACQKLLEQEKISKNPIKNFVSAVSVGIVDGQVLLDLCYEEDFKAEVDMNIVMSDKGDFVEIQGTGEKNTFNLNNLNKLIEFGQKGIFELIQIQKEVLKLI